MTFSYFIFLHLNIHYFQFMLKNFTLLYCLHNVCLQQNSRTHMWIYKELMNAFEQYFQEGQQIEITNLIVNLYDARKKNTCFQNDKYIALYGLTIVSPVLETVNMQEHVFNFTPFQDLPNAAQQDHFSTGIKLYSTSRIKVIIMFIKCHIFVYNSYNLHLETILQM